MNEYITIEEAARRIGRSRESIYAAVRRGRLAPIKRGRRSFFRDFEIAAYAALLDNRWPSKQEARALSEKFPEPPVDDTGQPVIDERAWSMFQYYANSNMAYDGVAEQFHVTRQRAQQVVANVIQKLTDIDAL